MYSANTTTAIQTATNNTHATHSQDIVRLGLSKFVPCHFQNCKLTYRNAAVVALHKATAHQFADSFDAKNFDPLLRPMLADLTKRADGDQESKSEGSPSFNMLISIALARRGCVSSHTLPQLK